MMVVICEPALGRGGGTGVREPLTSTQRVEIMNVETFSVSYITEQLWQLTLIKTRVLSLPGYNFSLLLSELQAC